MASRAALAMAGNLEAQAAPKYWGLVFGDKTFRRGPTSLTKTAISTTVIPCFGQRLPTPYAAGLHPSIGLQHKNRYHAFCLAADVMEPFRPLVDTRVSQWISREDAQGPFDSKTKSWMIGATTSRYILDREERSLFDTI